MGVRLDGRAYPQVPLTQAGNRVTAPVLNLTRKKGILEMSIRYNERGFSAKRQAAERDARKELTRLERVLRHQKGYQGNPVTLVSNVDQTMLEISPLGAAFNETPERNVRHLGFAGETRFMPQPHEYNYDQDWWAPTKKPDPTDRREPRHSSAVPRQMHGPMFIVRNRRDHQVYWRFQAPNWHLAQDEARVLASIAGYYFKHLEVRFDT